MSRGGEPAEGSDAGAGYWAGFVVAFGTCLSRHTTCCLEERTPLEPLLLLLLLLVVPLEEEDDDDDEEPLPSRSRQSLSDSQPM
jgi:hypothetical protein